MDEAKLAELLDQLTPDEIDAAAEELHAYARHRRIKPRGDVAAAPFNFGAFMKNFVKVVQVVWPVVGPLIGLDPKTAAPASTE